MKHWPRVKLGELLHSADDPHAVKEDEAYPNIGIYSFGRGLFRKPPINGISTSATSLFRVRGGNFIYSRLFAFEGAYGIVDDQFEGFFVSNEYPSFEVDRARLLPKFLSAYFRLPSVWQAIGMDSKGVGSRRIRIHPDKVLAHQIPLPPINEQQAIVARIDALADKSRQLAVHLDAIDADQLLTQHFRHATAGAPYRPMAEVAPLVRRPALIEANASYPELGIRSFGRGPFQKPAVSGLDLGSKRLFQIEAGDLLFSNVFAWEGAIAIARPEDAGRFGSHRFMTCVVNEQRALPGFLLYYLLSPDGLERVGEASPGGAGRNRTLGVDKLAKIEVPIPSLATQRAFVDLQATVSALKARHGSIRETNAALVPAMLERLFVAEDRNP